MLSPIHVIDFEGNRSYGIMEYGLVTLENNQITDIFHDHCRPQNFSQAIPFCEHSRFPNNINYLSFSEHLPLFKKKRKNGFFCAHNATIEDRLLRQYNFYPKIDEKIRENTQNILNFEDNFLFQNKILTKQKTQTGPHCSMPIEKISWGPWIDTYRIYKKYYPMKRNNTVAELIGHFRLEKKLRNLVAAHDNKKLTFHYALHDALATALLLQNFIDLFQVKDILFLF